MWQAIVGFFQRWILPSAASLLQQLTPVLAESASRLAVNKAQEWADRKSKDERRHVQSEIIKDLEQKGYEIGIDFTLDQIDQAAKAAVKRADEIQDTRR